MKSYGCQMNVYDSSRISGLLGAEGYSRRDVAEGSEVIVLNTCHIREKAADKVFSELGQLRALKQERASAGLATYVGVAGCVAQAEGAEILKREAAVDFVIGPQSYHRLPEALAKARAGERSLLVDFETEEKFEGLRRGSPVPTKKSVSAFLTIQEGCDKFCTFCVVPYTRGTEVSRPVAALLLEARRLAQGGVRELTLLGQNVNAYHGLDAQGRAVGLAGLVEQLSQIEGIERLRYMTSHPRDMTGDLIRAHAENEKLMPFLHLPFQSGADRILAAMNRKHTAEDYRQLVAQLRKARPDLALSTDVIVGFPGETEAEHQATVDLLKEIGFAQAYSFKYSPRPGTPAAEMPDQVEEAIKTERILHIQAVIDAGQAAFNSACVGRTLPVLFEKAGRKAGQIVGRSPYLQPVHVTAPSTAIGNVLPVEITSLGSYSLGGVIVGG